MEVINYQLLWEGIQLCIAIQLTILGILNIIKGTKQKLIVGFICLILPSYFYKIAFWEQVKENDLLITQELELQCLQLNTSLIMEVVLLLCRTWVDQKMHLNLNFH